MAVVPIKFRKSSELALNLGLTDFLTGRGYLTLFGGQTADRYLLSTLAFFSNEYPGKGTPLTANTAGDIDFDAVTETPLIFEGRGFVTVPLLHINNSGGAAAVNTTITVTLRKWDGSTETDIVSENVAANPFATVGNNNIKGQVWTVDFDIPRTKFKATDTIRITVETTAPGADREIVICHDPQDRDAVKDGSTGGGGSFTQPDTTALRGQLPVALEAL